MASVLPNQSFWQMCGWLSSRPPQTHIWELIHSCWLSLFPQHLHLVLFFTAEWSWWIMGSTFQVFLGHFSVTLSVKHWFVTALMLFKEILHEVFFFFALPYAALFMFSFYPAIHHSSVPWFKLWATLTELVHWSELGQVWNMNWVHVWVWLRVWCFSLLHVLPSFDLVYLVFPALHVPLDNRYFLQFL